MGQAKARERREARVAKEDQEKREAAAWAAVAIATLLEAGDRANPQGVTSTPFAYVNRAADIMAEAGEAFGVELLPKPKAEATNA